MRRPLFPIRSWIVIFSVMLSPALWGEASIEAHLFSLECWLASMFRVLYWAVQGEACISFLSCLTMIIILRTASRRIVYTMFSISP